jgi:hypothetical protein
MEVARFPQKSGGKCKGTTTYQQAALMRSEMRNEECTVLLAAYLVKMYQRNMGKREKQDQPESPISGTQRCCSH